MVSVEEGQISAFIDLSECPVALNVPLELNPLTGEILRRKNLNHESVYDDYALTEVPL
jgi:hypothetical protein